MIATIKGMIRSVWEAMRYGKPPDASKRSKRWPAVEKLHKQRESACQWCGRTDHVEVHHVLAFEDRPDLELDDGKDGSGKDGNLISLCRPPGSLFGDAANPLGSCHFQRGHKDNVSGKCSWKINDRLIRLKCDEKQAMAAEQRHRMGLLP